MPMTRLVALCLGDERVGEDLRVLRAAVTGAGGASSVSCGASLPSSIGGRPSGVFALLRRRLAVDDRAGLCGVPLLHPLEPAILGRRETLALDGLDVDDDGTVGVERFRERTAERGDIVAVDDAHVGEVELLEKEPRRPVRLEGGLDLGAKALDALAEPPR